MDRLKEFIRRDCYYGSGSNSTAGYYGCGHGHGHGFNSGEGDGGGGGSGYGYADESGEGYGYGDGDDFGHGYGPGSSCGGGSRSGTGAGHDQGFRSGVVSNIKSIGKQVVHHIDGVPTVIDHVRGNIAKGKILRSDFSLAPCFVVKSNEFFAHGETLKEAMSALQKKVFDGMSESERIDVFVGEFPSLEAVVKNKDLFEWHGKLTGSCEMGRSHFVVEKGINFNGKMTVGEFIDLTKNSYGGGTITRLLEHYMEDKDSILCKFVDYSRPQG